MNMKTIIEKIKAWQVLIAVIGSIAFIVTTSFAIERYFAKEKTVQLLTLNFEEYKTEEAIDRTQNRIWETEDRIKKQGETPELYEKLRELKVQKEKLERKRDIILKEQGGIK